MKLYTEEQVRKIYCIAFLGGHSKYIMDFEEDVKLISPIKLPSDEKIGEATRTKSLLDCSYETNFRLGVLWYQEQILNQNK